MTGSAANRASHVRAGGAVPAWVVFVVVLVAEYLLLSYLVDARDVLAPAAAQSVLGSIGSIAPLGFVSLAAVFLTGGATVRSRLRSLSAYRGGSRWVVGFATAHAIAFAAVLVLALKLASSESISATTGRAWLAVWFFTVASSFATLFLALWSRPMVFSAVRGLRRELTIGLCVGVFAWAAGLLAKKLWEPLSWLTLELVYALLTVIAPDPVASMESSLVGTSRFYVEVAPVCSGIEGVGLMLTFMSAFLYIERRDLKWPRSFVLLPLSALLVWALNVVRVTGLIAVGTWISPEVALGGFHSKAGWVFFTATALAAVLFVRRGETFRARSVASQQTEAAARPAHHPAEAAGGAGNSAAGQGSDPAAVTAAYIAPLLAVLAVKLATGLATSGFDVFYPLAVASALAFLVKFRRHYPAVHLDRSWLPAGVGVAVAVVWIVGFEPTGSPSQVGQGLAELPSWAAASWLVFRGFGSIVTVPIVEELAFRGFLLRRFVSADFDAVAYRRFSWLGLIVSSVAFGLMHSQWMLGIGAGFAFGILAIARGRLLDAVLAHAAANAAIFVYALSSGQWALLG